MLSAALAPLCFPTMCRTNLTIPHAPSSARLSWSCRRTLRKPVFTRRARDVVAMALSLYNATSCCYRCQLLDIFLFYTCACLHRRDDWRLPSGWMRLRRLVNENRSANHDEVQQDRLLADIGAIDLCTNILIEQHTSGVHYLSSVLACSHLWHNQDQASSRKLSYRADKPNYA